MTKMERGQRELIFSYISRTKGSVSCLLAKLPRMSLRECGEKHSSMVASLSLVSEGGVGGSPVLNSSIVESTISYFSSRVA